MAADPLRPTASVAVVVRDRREAMTRCLAAIARLSPAPAEVLVVDNGSRDGTPEMLRHHAPAYPVPLRLLVHPGSLGEARNAAVAAVRTDVVAFTDSDCEPTPGWLGAGLAAMGAGIGVVQGRTRPAQPVRRRWAATQDIAGLTGLYETCNIFYRVTVLRAAGGFSTSIGFFGEDTAAGWRVRRLGWQAAYAPEAVVEHAVSYPGLGWHLRRAFGYGHFADLVAEFPEMRTQLLWGRLFLRRRNAVAALGVASALAGGMQALRGHAPVAWAATLPWLIRHRPRRGGVAGIADAAGGLAYDAAVFAGLCAGSLRTGTPVL